jgi:hypothetical protein
MRVGTASGVRYQGIAIVWLFVWFGLLGMSGGGSRPGVAEVVGGYPASVGPYALAPKRTPLPLRHRIRSVDPTAVRHPSRYQLMPRQPVSSPVRSYPKPERW